MKKFSKQALLAQVIHEMMVDRVPTTAEDLQDADICNTSSSSFVILRFVIIDRHFIFIMSIEYKLSSRSYP